MGHFDWGSSKGKLLAASGTVPHNDITTLLPIENDIAAFCIKLLSPVSAEPTSAALQLLGASICVVWLSENLGSLKMLKDLDPIVNLKKSRKAAGKFWRVSIAEVVASTWLERVAHSLSVALLALLAASQKTLRETDASDC